jgi:hypothetical protein
MSLSEVFNHGVPIPWANVRFNNVTLDGQLISPTPAPTPGASGLTTTYQGSLRVTVTTPVVFFTYVLPNAPINSSTVIRCTTIFKGGPVGSTNNAFAQDTASLYVCTNNVVLSHLNFVNNATNPPIGFGMGTVGQVPALVGQTITLAALNNQGGQTTDIIWYVEVQALSTSL